MGRKQIVLPLLIILSFSLVNVLHCQSVQTRPTRQSSFEAFSKGDYEKAYNEFSELLLVYSKDPLYKYYSGVCLIKLKRNPIEAASFLKQSIQNAGVVKTLPSDALFYLGRAQQMSGNYSEAIDSYNLYAKQVGKKTAREQNVPDFIQQCTEKKGKLSEPEIKPDESAGNEAVKPDHTETKSTVKDVITQPVEKNAPVGRNLPSGFDKITDEALEFQRKADSVNAIMVTERKELELAPESGKAALKAKISSNEQLAASFQRSADQKYKEAQLAMGTQQLPVDQKETPPLAVKMENRDSVGMIVDKPLISAENKEDNKSVISNEKQSDTSPLPGPAVSKPAEIFTVFEVLPKPESGPDNKIKIDPEVPEGLIYRIQVAVFRNPVAPSYFKGITPVYGFRVSGTDKTNYYAGMFRKSADAFKALAAVKSKGFKDAFVVALSGNKPVSADRAAILEKEWGRKPFPGMESSVVENKIDTIPPTLSFRVEVARSAKPLKDEVAESFRKLAGNRGLDIQTLNDGNIVYLIGKFITFESAAEYADLLVRNGYRDAKVVAWLGKKEIPLETARQLIEKVE